MFSSCSRIVLTWDFACNTTHPGCHIASSYFPLRCQQCQPPLFLNINFREKNCISPTCSFVCFWARAIDHGCGLAYALSATGSDRANAWAVGSQITSRHVRHHALWGPISLSGGCGRMGTVGKFGRCLVPRSEESTLPLNIHNLLLDLHRDLLRLAGYSLLYRRGRQGSDRSSNLLETTAIWGPGFGPKLKLYP